MKKSQLKKTLKKEGDKKIKKNLKKVVDFLKKMWYK